MIDTTWNYLRMRGEYTRVMGITDLEVELPPHARRIRYSWWACVG